MKITNIQYSTLQVPPGWTTEGTTEVLGFPGVKVSRDIDTSVTQGGLKIEDVTSLGTLEITGSSSGNLLGLLGKIAIVQGQPFRRVTGFTGTPTGTTKVTLPPGLPALPGGAKVVLGLAADPGVLPGNGGLKAHMEGGTAGEILWTNLPESWILSLPRAIRDSLFRALGVAADYEDSGASLGTVKANPRVDTLPGGEKRIRKTQPWPAGASRMFYGPDSKPLLPVTKEGDQVTLGWDECPSERSGILVGLPSDSLGSVAVLVGIRTEAYSGASLGVPVWIRRDTLEYPELSRASLMEFASEYPEIQAWRDLEATLPGEAWLPIEGYTVGPGTILDLTFTYTTDTDRGEVAWIPGETTVIPGGEWDPDTVIVRGWGIGVTTGGRLGVSLGGPVEAIGGTLETGTTYHVILSGPDSQATLEIPGTSSQWTLDLDPAEIPTGDLCIGSQGYIGRVGRVILREESVDREVTRLLVPVRGGGMIDLVSGEVLAFAGERSGEVIGALEWIIKTSGSTRIQWENLFSEFIKTGVPEFYSTDGLVVMLDKIQDCTLDSWTDLIGGLVWTRTGTVTMGTSGAPVFGAGGYYSRAAINSLASVSTGTIEIAFKAEVLKFGQYSFFFDSGNGQNGVLAIPYRGSDRTISWRTTSTSMYRCNDDTVGLKRFSGNSQRVVLNGQAVSAYSSETRSASGSYSTIGCRGNLGDKLPNGEIYSIRIYNRILTEEEMKLHQEIDRIRFSNQ